MSDRVKYPKTFHLPWSNGNPSNDKTLSSDENFQGEDVIVTLKMDGENTTLYHDGLHPRSLIMDHHPSRNWIKTFHGSIQRDIPEDIRICGENLYAQHSIVYEDLPTYFMAFSVWVGEECLDWVTTKFYCEQLGIQTVPVIYEGKYDKTLIQHIFNSSYADKHEGYVVRLSGSFHYHDFQEAVAKFVRLNHIQTDEHWMHKQVKPNGLKK